MNGEKQTVWFEVRGKKPPDARSDDGVDPFEVAGPNRL